MKKTALAAAVVTAIFSVFSPYCLAGYLQGKPEHEPQKRFDILHYRLNIRLFPEEKSLAGSVGIRLVSQADTLTTLQFDADTMAIDSVTLSPPAPLSWKKTPGNLSVILDRPLAAGDTVEVRISYRLKEPVKGLYFNLPDTASGENDLEVYSQGEMEDNHYWFPCWDFPNDRATSETIVTVPDTLMVISNGKLLEVADNGDGTKTFHWYMAQPHVSYLISIVAGNYARVRDHYKSIPVDYYVHPEDTANARLTFQRTPDMIALFSQLLGYEYPYAKYAQTLVHKFRYGGMENISATTLNYSSLRDRRSLIDGSAEGLISHELAHQWFGDLVTCRTWAHSWLNEGFATYFSAIWYEHARGWPYLQRSIENDKELYFTEDTFLHRRALAWARYSQPEDLFDRHAYQKGAAVLHMLRHELGDSLFWKGLHHYLEKYEWRCVTSADFKQALEEATGRNLTPFFTDWVYGAGHPELKVSKFYDPERHQLTLTVLQTQEKDSLCTTFHFPVDIEITAARETRSYRVRVERDSATFTFPCSSKPLMVRFDKGHWLLKKLDFPKPAGEWVFQLHNDSDALGRMDAIRTLGDSLSLPGVAAELASQFSQENVDFVRREIIRTLSSDTSGALAGILPAALHDPNSGVRTEAVRALAENPQLMPSPFDTLLTIYRSDSSYSVQRQVLNAAVTIDSARAIPLIAEALETPSFRETLRGGALNAIRKARLHSFLPKLLELTEKPVPDIVRYQALLTLTQLDEDNPQVYQVLLRHLQDSYFPVRRICASALNRIRREDSLPALKAALAKEKMESIRSILQRAIDRIEETKQPVEAPQK